MSTRLIASVGVILCAAMTSFSIYLGVIERVYTPKAHVTHTLGSETQRQLQCQQLQLQHNTPTTIGPTNALAHCQFASAGL